MDKNKIKFGLKNVHRAPITIEDGVVKYGTPVPMPGAVNLSLKGAVERVDVPADDDPQYASITENNGYDGDIEFQIFSDEDKVACLGAHIDDNGCCVESKDDQPQPQALLFEFAGDKKSTRHVLYNCLFTKPDVESATRGDKVETKTDKLTIAVRPAKDTGHIKFKTSEKTPEEIYDNWYSEVHLPVATAETRITPDDALFDLKEENQADIVINVLKKADESLESVKKGNSILVADTDYSITGNQVTLKKDYLSTLSEGVVKLAFNFTNGVKKYLQITVIHTEDAE